MPTNLGLKFKYFDGLTENLYTCAPYEATAINYAEHCTDIWHTVRAWRPDILCMYVKVQPMATTLHFTAKYKPELNTPMKLGIYAMK